MSKHAGTRTVVDRATIDLLLRHRKDGLDLSVGEVLIQLARFLACVEEHGFSLACRKLLGDQVRPEAPAEAVERVAIWATQSLPDLSGAVFSKALQEALLEACGIEQDSELSDAERCVRKYLMRTTVSGFLELCLCLYVFHTIWLLIHDDLRHYYNSERTFAGSMSVVRKLSQAAVADAIRDAHDFEGVRISQNAGVRIMNRIRERLLVGFAGLDHAY